MPVNAQDTTDIKVRIPQVTYTALREVAKGDDRSISYVVRRAVIEYVAREHPTTK